MSGEMTRRKTFSKSSDMTEEQLIFYAKQRSNRRRLTTNDLFDVFGAWSPFHLRVIFLNGMVYCLTDMHYQMVYVADTKREHYRFQDCNNVIYDLPSNTRLISDISIENRTDFTEENNGLAILGDCIGATVAATFSTQESRMVLFGSVMYALSCLMMNVKYMAILKLAQIVMAAASQFCRVAVLLHCLESVPARIRPLAMFTMTAIGVVGTQVLTLVIFHLPDWWHIYNLFGIFHLSCVFVYHFLIPPSILNALATGNCADLAEELDKWTDPEDEPLDVTALVDDVNFRGQVAVTKRESLILLFKVVPFRRKLMILVFLLPLFCLLDFVSDPVFRECTSISGKEQYIFGSMVAFVCLAVACAVVYRFGRRAALLLAVLLPLVGQCLALVVPLNGYNLSARAEVPTKFWSTVGMIAAFSVKGSAHMGYYLSYLMRYVFRICGLTSVFLLGYVLFFHDISSESDFEAVAGNRAERHIVQEPEERPKMFVNKKKVVIYAATKFFRMDITTERFLSECTSTKGYCRISESPDDLKIADAILFHNADYMDSRIPQPRDLTRPHVLWSLESPSNDHFRPGPNVINWTMTPRRDADIWYPYGHFEKLERPQEYDLDSIWKMKDHSKTATWLASNCHTQNRRLDTIKKMMENGVKADLYGKCGQPAPNCDGVDKQGNDCVIQLVRPYKFYFSIENSNCIDYVTEKFYETLLHRMAVPIVLARKYYEDVGAPADSFIAVDDFSSVAELAKYINKVKDDKELYLKHHAWRKTHRVLPEHDDTSGFCELCRRLQSEIKDYKSYANIQEWNSLNKCDNSIANRFL